MNGTTAHPGLISASRPCKPVPCAHRRFVWRTLISALDPDHLRQLLAQCALGDRRAFESLYRSVAPRLHGVALRFMGRHDLAEEVLQESFIRIWNNASRYQAHLSAPLTWMTHILRNQAIDQLRKHRDRPLSEREEQQLPDEGPSAHELLDSARQGPGPEPLPGQPGGHATSVDQRRLLPRPVLLGAGRPPGGAPGLGQVVDPPGHGAPAQVP